MTKIYVSVAVCLGLALAYLGLAPVPIDPVAWTPEEIPAPVGVWEPNERLSSLKRLAENEGIGPEDTAIGPDGLLYAGYADGRIVRLASSATAETGVELVADTNGRPLGLQFAPNGELIVADGIKGLLAISISGEIRLLTNSVDGNELLFVDDLDISGDGKIWFSDASQRFALEDNLLDFVESRSTGRLLSYDPSSGVTKVELENLGFANGVALSEDEDFVLVNETFRHRVTRLWLTGPKAGQSDLFSGNLPGHPDNLSRAPDGSFWVALVVPRNEALETLMPTPFWRKVMMRLPESLRGGVGAPFGWVAHLDAQGQVIESLQDPNGHFGMITSVNEHDGTLYLGSLTEAAIGRLSIASDKP